MEDRFTIEPPPCFTIRSATARDMRNVPFMFTAITKSQTFSQSQSSGAFRGATPALFTSTSARPNRFTVSSTSRCESARLVTSPTITSASPRAVLTWAATVSRSADGRSASATFAPSCANTTAVAAPMPDPAPVISATLSRSRPAIWSPPWVFWGASPYHGVGLVVARPRGLLWPPEGPMDYRTIRYEQLGAVARITANRPEVLNAQSRVMILELDAAFRAASEDDATRVIIVAGAGAHFSAGHDLGSREELEDQKAHPVGPGMPENLKRLSELYLEATLRWRDVPKPTIAQVQGYCIMGGLMLASCCDLIIAADDAQFADRMVRWGGAHVQYFSMPWDLGPRKAKEYLFTGDYIDATTALELGLVNRVVPRAELDAATLELAQRIALQDSFALKLAKASVNETVDIQGQRRALESSFKNYMLTIPHRQALGTYGAAARARGVKDRIKTRDTKFGDAAGG